MSYRGCSHVKNKGKNVEIHRIGEFHFSDGSKSLLTDYCHSGARSSAAVAVHKSTGNDDVKTIDGIRDYKGPSERGDKS